MDELELRLQEALQESQEQHRSLAEENATLQQRVRQVSKRCCAQGYALLPQRPPGWSGTALAGAEVDRSHVCWVGCFVLQQGSCRKALAAHTSTASATATLQQQHVCPGQQGSARSAGHVCQISMCARSAGLCNGAPWVGPQRELEKASWTSAAAQHPLFSFGTGCCSTASRFSAMHHHRPLTAFWPRRVQVCSIASASWGQPKGAKGAQLHTGPTQRPGRR